MSKNSELYQEAIDLRIQNEILETDSWIWRNAFFAYVAFTWIMVFC